MGDKEVKMETVATVTRVGQVTIPKVMRDALGIIDRVRITHKGDEIIIKREKTLDERLDEAWAKAGPGAKERAIKLIGNKTVNELKEEIMKEGLTDLERRRYGL